MSNGIKIGVIIVLITIFIYIIKNYKEILNYLKNNKKIKIIYNILIIVLILFLIYYIYIQIKKIVNNINFYNTTKINNEMFAEFDKKIEEENLFYKNVINENYINQNSMNPYIFEGFEYVEGEWNTGFVIQDENKNQFVWVPCTNLKDENILKLEKSNFKSQAEISKDMCADDEYEEFMLSALENGGFYISRYEIGNEENKPVSKENVNVWTSLTRQEAIEISNSMYDNINSKLINGYAYDTTLSWIEKNNNVSADKVDVRENVYTGRNQYNNIYDFTDNIMEYTLERFYDTVIIRGFAYSKENEDESRYAINEDEDYFDYVSLIGFRTILYK